MDTSKLVRRSENEWVIAPDSDPRAQGMRVPGVIFATEALVREMDEKVY